MTRPLVALFKHNLWANLRVLDACAGLSGEQLQATAAGTYGTIGDTLVHVLAAEGRYVHEFTKGVPDVPLAEGDRPGFDLLYTRAEMSGEALIDLAGQTPDDHVLRGTYRGQDYEMPADLMFTQAINHATEHRTHIAAILTQLGIEPPRTDAIAFWRAHHGG